MLPPIAVLLGGPSAEHDVSIVSGTAIAEALAGTGTEVTQHLILLQALDRGGPVARNSDVNAAKVILKRALAAGHAVTACGENVRPCMQQAISVKQEPTRGAQKCAV